MDVHEELKLVRRDLSDLTDAVRALFATRAFDHADFHKIGGALHGVALAAQPGLAPRPGDAPEPRAARAGDAAR